MTDPLNCNNPPNLKFAYDNNGSKYIPPEICVGEASYSTGECADNEANYIASLQAEMLEMSAGPINVFPMLGVHNQGSTVDLVSANGYPISSGTPSGFNALDAFNSNSEEWRSVQQGADVLTSAFIGYNFGTKKAWDKIGPSQERYQSPQLVRKQIGSIKIKQSFDSKNRISKAKIEASDDGIKWIHIKTVNLPDVTDLVTIGVNASAMYNQWRIVPTFFNGVASNSQWGVIEIRMLEETSTSLDNIQDFFLMENRDRSYSTSSVLLKCQYDLLDVQSELAKFGISLPQTYIFTCSFSMMIQRLGRPIVVGDIVEVPGEVQYDTDLNPVRKWLEVSDTAWSTEGYALNWKPQMFKFYAQPIMPSVEHRDILGLPGQINEHLPDGDFLQLQNDQAYKSTEAFLQEMKDKVPQTGTDPQNIMSGTSLGKPSGSYDGRDLYVQDGIPANGKPFTIGDALPTGVVAGSYHRQTYTNIPLNIRPPERLLKYDGSRWRVIEVNTRKTPQSNKPSVANMITSENKVNLDSLKP